MSSQPSPQRRTSSPLPRFLIPAAWISFVLNVLIIATGGAVRLTGSGLGCSEWPLCTPDSFVPTEELGIHGLIEFGNRTISGPLLIAALIVLILSIKIRNERKDLFVLSIIITALILLQAVVGGFVVWEGLKAVLVGFHYTVSLIIVCIAAAYLVRAYSGPGPYVRDVPKGFAITSHVMTLFMAIVIVMGVITTGNGPHSGDENVIRDGFDATLLSHLHAWPGYITLALLVVLIAWAFQRDLRPLKWLLTLLIVMVVQILVGVFQARSGLPPVAVGVHMVLASLTAATMTVTIMKLKKPLALDASAAPAKTL
ncbi:MAG: COX15/CtaA family protein [Microbacteriaceae bacterium]|nr:COX15/CtaA family protein [Leucobacter sp. UCMA 4100]